LFTIASVDRLPEFSSRAILLADFEIYLPEMESTEFGKRRGIEEEILCMMEYGFNTL
jgi:hypothetical protein